MWKSKSLLSSSCKYVYRAGLSKCSSRYKNDVATDFRASDPGSVVHRSHKERRRFARKDLKPVETPWETKNQFQDWSLREVATFFKRFVRWTHEGLCV